MTFGTLIALVLGGIIGWASSAAVQRDNRRAEAKAMAAALWAELSVIHETGEQLGVHALYRQTVAAWAETGVLPDEDFWRGQFGYSQTDAYPYYAAAIPKIGILGADLAAEITAYHATERVIIIALQSHFSRPAKTSLAQSKIAGERVGALVNEFLARRENLIENLESFEPEPFNWRSMLPMRYLFPAR